MAQLQIKVIGGRGFDDISLEPGCCDDRKPSQPMLYFLLDSTVGVWASEPAPMDGSGAVSWDKQFMHIKCRDPESDRLEFYAVDGAHWKPDMRCGQGNRNSDPPNTHFYGMYKMSVIQFERAKKETQTLVLQTKQKADTKYSFTVEGMFHDSNIDDGRVDQPAAAVAPPPVTMPGAVPGPPTAPPVAQAVVGPPVAQPAGAAGWDGSTWPPNGPPQVPLGEIPAGVGPPRTVGAGTHVSLNIGNGGDTSQGSDVGDQSNLMIAVLSSCRIHWSSLYGRIVLVNCQCTDVDPMPGADVHVYGGVFRVGTNKGGQVTIH
eukprot:TRINITY_DN11143_c0_g1_i1.p1 TRINITY_DN11143_c0_g1~~TRINITY_DN11143_c0_g1_i1.p1  ORF type:complete len:317 (+),score=82.36 TRINITY_DN11143_c0_g1_i1:52-1002(+)